VPEFDQILSTFRFVEKERVVQNLDLPWPSVCDKLDSKPFDVTARPGEGLTHMGRRATSGYITAATIESIPNPPPAFTQAQRVFVEDYIKDYLKEKGITPSKSTTIPCELVEIAFMATTKLTASQQANLEIYARSSISLDALREIQAVIQDFSESGLPIYMIAP